VAMCSRRLRSLPRTMANFAAYERASAATLLA
jgi:hypothetical protein